MKCGGKETCNARCSRPHEGDFVKIDVQSIGHCLSLT